MTITTKMHQHRATRTATAVVVATAAALLFANGARLVLRGATGSSGGDDGVMAEAESALRTTEPVAVSRPVGAGRSVPGPGDWLTYTDSGQRWQIDVPAPLRTLNAGPDADAVAAVDGDLTYSMEWTPAPGTLDLFTVARDLIDTVQSDTASDTSGEVVELAATVEPSSVGELDAVRFSVDIGVGTELLRHSGVIVQIDGDLVSATVIDYGGNSPLEADSYLSSLRTLS